jgi:gluconolactonase
MKNLTIWKPHLAAAIAAGVTLVVADLSAHAQTTAAVALTPAIAGVAAAGTPIQLIREGFAGTEGPVVLPDGSLIFTETQANRITRIAADGSTSTFLDNTNGSNGLGFTANGDLYAVQVLKPRVGIVYPPRMRARWPTSMRASLSAGPTTW